MKRKMNAESTKAKHFATAEEKKTFIRTTSGMKRKADSESTVANYFPANTSKKVGTENSTAKYTAANFKRQNDQVQQQPHAPLIQTSTSRKHKKKRNFLPPLTNDNFTQIMDYFKDVHESQKKDRA